jgi:hypothetical protein
MLKFEFPKQLHAKDNKVNFLFLINKVLKWFGGSNLNVYSQSLGFKP